MQHPFPCLVEMHLVLGTALTNSWGSTFISCYATTLTGDGASATLCFPAPLASSTAALRQFFYKYIQAQDSNNEIKTYRQAPGWFTAYVFSFQRNSVLCQNNRGVVLWHWPLALHPMVILFSLPASHIFGFKPIPHSGFTCLVIPMAGLLSRA